MTDVVMPQMGESIVEGTLTRWLKKPGEQVERDEPLFEISTDKVDTEIPSPSAGVLSEILVQEGTTVAINSVVARIGEANGAAPAAAPAAQQSAPPPSASTTGRTAAPPPPTPAQSPADVGPSARAGGASQAAPPPSSCGERRGSVSKYAVTSAAARTKRPGRWKRRRRSAIATSPEDGARIQHRPFADPRHGSWRADHQT